MRHKFASSLVLLLIIPAPKGPLTTAGPQLFTHFVTQPTELACFFTQLFAQHPACN